ncbi:ankyrin repeat and IBR domain-containing protein 1-like [Anabas testudineus]|uniref:ankyrin repeat and IBR domain-containing protein 1-like n=1 Tax=Anabas testudineus TaxID=64144 RepID=UPI000E465EEE|nr:ankyrin repeat and IBR domain-containing protein 1-like [Anabas testudineus]
MCWLNESESSPVMADISPPSMNKNTVFILQTFRSSVLRGASRTKTMGNSSTVQQFRETEVTGLPRVPDLQVRDTRLNRLEIPNVTDLNLHIAHLEHYLELHKAPREKCYDPQDTTLTFVDREDELDFLCEGFSSPRALMSCGHAVTPTSLTNWCLRLLDEGESTFVCGQTGCNVEWPYEEVCKMALLTHKEKRHFEKTMAFNAARGYTKSCPGCTSSVVRTNQSDLRVHCTVCSANKGRSYDFCWQCLREWKGPAPRSDHCDNDGCTNESLKTLTTCPEITFKSRENATRCPSIRACPTCGILLQHDNTMCKNVRCPRCKMEFCFVCLKLTCFSWCSCVAPRQTSIPVWQKK